MEPTVEIEEAIDKCRRLISSVEVVIAAESGLARSVLDALRCTVAEAEVAIDELSQSVCDHDLYESGDDEMRCRDCGMVTG